MANILLVEDNPEILLLLADALKSAGYRLAYAGNIAQAQRHLADGSVDMLVTDIVLPDGNGTALAREAEAQGIPALVITGSPHWILALADAGLDYLHKPFRAWQLLDRIRHRLPMPTAEAAD